MIKNCKQVLRYMLGRGAFARLDELLAPRRANGAWSAFFVDHYFHDKPLASQVPSHRGDEVVFVDTTHEPKTSDIDALRERLGRRGGLPGAVVGIGGGATLDTAKAVSNLLTNP